MSKKKICHDKFAVNKIQNNKLYQKTEKKLIKSP